MNPPLPRLRRLATAAAVLLVGTSTALVSTPAHATTSGHSGRGGGYVALGDSFAAGEGLPPYEKGTNTATDQCHRSARLSYPELLERGRIRAFDHLTSVACSGAITASLFRTIPEIADEPAQLDALQPRTKTVTLSIGGNDAGFSEVLTTCIHAVPGTPDPECRAKLNDRVSARIANLASPTPNPAFPYTVPLPRVIAAIHAQAPQAEIYVSSNPQLVGTTFTQPYGCIVGSVGPAGLALSADDARWIREKATDLAAAVAKSVALARAAGIDAHFVDIGRRFDGHNLCDTKKPWLNPVSFTSIDPPQLDPASLHPTARGQVAYARAFAQAAERHHRWSDPRH